MIRERVVDPEVLPDHRSAHGSLKGAIGSARQLVVVDALHHPRVRRNRSFGLSSRASTDAYSKGKRVGLLADWTRT